jgi:hypothetical protein
MWGAGEDVLMIEGDKNKMTIVKSITHLSFEGGKVQRGTTFLVRNTDNNLVAEWLVCAVCVISNENQRVKRCAVMNTRGYYGTQRRTSLPPYSFEGLVLVDLAWLFSPGGLFTEQSRQRSSIKTSEVFQKATPAITKAANKLYEEWVGHVTEKDFGFPRKSSRVGIFHAAASDMYTLVSHAAWKIEKEKIPTKIATPRKVQQKPKKASKAEVEEVADAALHNTTTTTMTIEGTGAHAAAPTVVVGSQGAVPLTPAQYKEHPLATVWNQMHSTMEKVVTAQAAANETIAGALVKSHKDTAEAMALTMERGEAVAKRRRMEDQDRQEKANARAHELNLKKMEMEENRNRLRLDEQKAMFQMLSGMRSETKAAAMTPQKRFY